MKILIRSLFVVWVVFAACTRDTSVTNPTDDGLVSAKIAVFSDAHYYAPVLGTEGSAFETYLAQDRKMLAESDAIMDAAVAAILASDVEMVLAPGDLTKDGALESHTEFVVKLQELENAGIKVYVAPGNHDVNNPQARSYAGETATPVTSVTADDFELIYDNFGYAEAIDHDPHSLSYIAKPKPGLWLFCLDVCKYEDNQSLGHPETSGRFRPETLEWLLEKLQEAQRQDILCLGMMHHNLLEHFSMQNEFFADYVVDDWQTVAAQLAEAGLKVMFTGHFHAQDVVKFSSDESFIFDIETGSLVTAPSPYRLVTLADNVLTVESRYIEDIDYDTGGAPFPEYAMNYLTSGLPGVVEMMLQMQFGASPEEAATVAPLLTGAMVAHYAGDEQMPPEVAPLVQAMLGSGDQLQMLIGNALNWIYTDPHPADNSVEIDLISGTASSNTLF